MPITQTHELRRFTGHGAARRELAALAADARDSDEAQDVLLRALVQPPRIQKSWAAWFQGALRLRRLELMRAEGRRRARELVTSPRETGATPPAELESAELGDVLEEKLAGLDAGSREILHEHYWNNVSLTSIARRLGCDLGVVKRRHARALDALRTHLGVVERTHRHWASFPWILLALALAVGSALWFTSPAATTSARESAPTVTAMWSLTPAMPRAPQLPAVMIEPSRPTAGDLSVPMIELTPVKSVEPVEPIEPEPLPIDLATAIVAL